MSAGQTGSAPDIAAPRLNAARTALASALRKNEKARETLSARQPVPQAQLRRVSRNCTALSLALALVTAALAEAPPSVYSRAELDCAGQVLHALIRRLAALQPKFQPGTPQSTLVLRRLDALRVASALVEQALEPPPPSPA